MVDALTAENAYAGLLLVLDERGIDKLPAPLRLRASGFVKKPLVPSALLEEVERALAESRMARVLPGGFPASARPASTRTPEPAGNADQLKRAIHGLYLAFQPVVRAFDQSIYGFEALVRSRSASLAGPEQLLAAAERLGQTEGLGRAARGLVAKALNEHPGRQDTLFVNLHPEEVLTHALRPEDDPLLPFAHRVVFDLAQPARLFDPARVEEFVRRWRALGFRFALDGIGDAAVRQTWLNRLTPEVAKLDISLVRDIQNSRSKRVVVASAVADCRRVGTVLVAVGVETSAEAALMHDLGCELLQGYYFARPSPPFPEVRIDGLVGG